MMQPNPQPTEPRDARLERLARAIREGTYDPDPRAIAEALPADPAVDPEDDRAFASAH